MKKFFLSVAVLAVLFLFPLTGFLVSRAYRVPRGVDVDAGKALLQTLDSVPLEEVKTKVAENEQKKLEALAQAKRSLKTQEIISLLQAGQLSYRKALSDLYIAGDSLMAGLSVYDILSASHIFAEVSASLSHLETNLNAIEAKRPPILLLHYGLNMISTSDAQLNTFIKRYTSLIERLKKDLPNTRLVVSMLFPVDREKATNPEFGRIDAYNDALKEMCDSLGVEAFDSTPAFAGKESSYGADGIHLSASFYRNDWLIYLLRALEIGA